MIGSHEAVYPTWVDEPGNASETRTYAPDSGPVARETSTGEPRRAKIAVFGAGPAGLAAAICARSYGMDVQILEIGTYADQRARYGSEDLVTGLGGAGLYSDGKFSFYPAATRLWRLDDVGALKAAYRWLNEILGEHMELPPFPEQAELAHPVRTVADGVKRYPSKYIDFPSRLSLIGSLTSSLGNSVTLHAFVEAIERRGAGALDVSFRTEAGVHTTNFDAVIMAGGRLGGVALRKQAPWMPTVFRRFEVGVRLESAANTFFLQNDESLDPKLVLRDSGLPSVEWRTFCTCRNGEIVETEFLGLRSYSARSDTTPTRHSSVGFNVRLSKEPRLNSRLADELERALSGKVEPFRLALRDYVAGNERGYGRTLDRLLRRGLGQLTLDLNDPSALVTGPCVEGIGLYPLINNSLKVPGAPIWVAGDQTGIFRGLTAAFLSGHYAAQKVNEYLANRRL